MKDILEFIWLALWALGIIGLVLYFCIAGPWAVSLVVLVIASLGIGKAKEILKKLVKG